MHLGPALKHYVFKMNLKMGQDSFSSTHNVDECRFLAYFKNPGYRPVRYCLEMSSKLAGAPSIILWHVRFDFDAPLPES